MFIARAVRRKYGIPDSSKEPFNVAYAKAEKTKKEQRQRQASPRIFDRREPVQQSSSFQRAPKLSTPQQRASAARKLLIADILQFYVFLIPIS